MHGPEVCDDFQHLSDIGPVEMVIALVHGRRGFSLGQELAPPPTAHDDDQWSLQIAGGKSQLPILMAYILTLESSPKRSLTGSSRVAAVSRKLPLKDPAIIIFA